MVGVVVVVGLLDSREGEGELKANRERTLFRRKRSGTPEGCQEVRGQEASCLQLEHHTTSLPSYRELHSHQWGMDNTTVLETQTKYSRG